MLLKAVLAVALAAAVGDAIVPVVAAMRLLLLPVLLLFLVLLLCSCCSRGGSRWLNVFALLLSLLQLLLMLTQL